jgi:NAD(P)-dependent dehydrogenase (short-subunit alcohol dehydrogenase family)
VRRNQDQPVTAAPDFSLQGRTALVTGASRGIGEQAALTLAGAGAAVVLASRSTDELEKVAAAARSAGAPTAEVVTTDVTDEEAVEAAVARAVEATGRLDVLVNVAGGSRFSAPVAATRTDGWDKVVSLNLRAVFLSCRAAIPHLGQGGAIVNVASVAAFQASPTMSAYSAAKAGVVALTRTLAVEAAPLGVRVNCLAPGWVRTELTRFLWSDTEQARGIVAQVPLGRWGEPAEMAGALLLLASDAGSYITGTTVVVDGGMLAR